MVDVFLYGEIFLRIKNLILILLIYYYNIVII